MPQKRPQLLPRDWAIELRKYIYTRPIAIYAHDGPDSQRMGRISQSRQHQSQQLMALQMVGERPEVADVVVATLAVQSRRLLMSWILK